VAQRLDPVELGTAAPIVGDVLDTFESRLDERNPLRLPTLSADAGALGPYWLAAASLTGRSHLHKAITGQDSFSYALADDGGAVVASVTDGLGSRPHSQVGSTLVARLLCLSLGGQRSEEVLRAPEQAVRRAQRRIGRQLRVLAPRYEGTELACTAVFCWISTDPANRVLIAGRVGDCALFILRDGDYQAVFPRDDGPLNVVRDFLPRPAGVDDLEVAELELGDEELVVLATDGLAEDVYGSEKVRAWLADRWAGPCGPSWMVDALRYRRKGSQDDRTALAIWLDPERALARLDAVAAPAGDPAPDP
jgi:serine/threonine protein phosphatase PrpC